MIQRFLLFTAVAAAEVLAASTAAGAEPDVSSLYTVSSEGSSQRVKSGAKGTLVLSIRTQAGAHVSDEAPLRIEISGTGLAPEKGALSYGDSRAKKSAAQPYPDPRFEVAFLAKERGKGELKARMTFFVCTEKVCARQQRVLSIPVDVD